MGAEHEILEPCLDQVARQPIDGGRVRVLEVMATGTNGGAQEHVYSLVTRLNPECYEVRVVSLSHGSSVRRLQRAGIDVTVIDEPDDRQAVRALADSVAAVRSGGNPQPHVPSRSDRYPCRPPARREGLQASGHHLDGPFEPGPLHGGSPDPPPADAPDGPADRGLQGHRAEGRATKVVWTFR